MFDSTILLKLILIFVPMLISLTVHEFAHAYSAYLLGDDTAKLNGRMTLNPISHIDLFGTVLLPLMLVISNSGVFFGWAKPVPINPVNFTRKISMKTGILITALAGPLSNLGLAIISVILLKVMFVFGVKFMALYSLFYYLLSINLILMLFNLIPFPPLDGSKVLAGVLPDSASAFVDYIERNPWIYMVGLFAIIYFAGILISKPYNFLLRLLLSVFGIPI